MSRPFWRAISALPDCWIGSLGLSRSAIPLMRREPIAIARGSTNPPRRHSGNTAREVMLAFDVPSDRAVMITNMLAGYEIFEVKSARAGDVGVIAAAENDLSAVFHAPKSATGNVRWTFRLLSTNPEAVDVVSIAGRKGEELGEGRCLAR
jgi:hypothetical protein